MTKSEFQELPIIDQLEYGITESVKTFNVAKLNEYQKGQLNMATHILEQITRLKNFNQ